MYFHDDTAKILVDVVAGYMGHGQPTIDTLRRIPVSVKPTVARCRCLLYHLARTEVGNVGDCQPVVIW